MYDLPKNKFMKLSSNCLGLVNDLLKVKFMKLSSNCLGLVHDLPKVKFMKLSSNCLGLVYDLPKDQFKVFADGEKVNSGSWSENPNVRIYVNMDDRYQF